MSAVDEIQAAIVNLTELVDSRGYSVYNGWLIEIDNSLLPDDPRVPLTSDEYMLTLHRTIDPQIAILQDAAEGYWKPGDAPDNWEAFVSSRAALALARAINGTT